MSKLLYCINAKFIKTTELDGAPCHGSLEEYVNAYGILGIYASEHLAPGKEFLRFFTPEPDGDQIRFFYTSVGEFEEDNDGYICFVSKHHKYYFDTHVDDSIVQNMKNNFFI